MNLGYVEQPAPALAAKNIEIKNKKEKKETNKKLYTYLDQYSDNPAGFAEEQILAFYIPFYIREQWDFVSFVCKQLESWIALSFVSADRTITGFLGVPSCN